MENNKEHYASEDNQEESPRIKKVTSKRKNSIFIVVFLLLVFGSYAYSYWKETSVKTVSVNETVVKDTLDKFIKGNMVQPGTDVKITDFKLEGDLYKLTVSVGGKDIISYATKDGKKFFPQVVDLDKGSLTVAPSTTTTIPACGTSN